MHNLFMRTTSCCCVRTGTWHGVVTTNRLIRSGLSIWCVVLATEPRGRLRDVAYCRFCRKVVDGSRDHGFRRSDAIRGYAQLVGWPAVIQEGPTEFAYNEHVRSSRDVLAGRSSMRTHHLERFCPGHADEAARKSDSALERRAVQFNNGHYGHSRPPQERLTYRVAFFLAGRLAAGLAARRACALHPRRGIVMTLDSASTSPRCGGAFFFRRRGQARQLVAGPPHALAAAS